jgi:hypothetical protein
VKNFFRSWQTLPIFWELVLCRLLQRCTNYWEDPQFREYLVIKLSDVKSGSRTLNPGIWLPVSGQLLATHSSWVMIREDSRWGVHSVQCCASANLEIDGFRTKAGFGRSGLVPSEAHLELWIKRETKSIVR